MPMPKSKVTLVIGGVRSGKSSYAEALVKQVEGRRVYIATAEPFDAEMQSRIARHKEARKDYFAYTIEEPRDVALALDSLDDSVTVALVDCMTVWMGNLLHYQGLRDRYEEVDSLLKVLQKNDKQVVIVTNEVGQGIVPATELSRHFRDHAGWLNQALAALADTVIWMVAGIPVCIKGELPS